MSEARAKPDPSVPPPSRLPDALAKAARRPKDARKTAAHHFDKAFPVFLTSVRGIANGVGRNITEEGMFIETRDPCPLGSELRITFEAPAIGTELTAVGEVRFQAFLNYAGQDGQQEGLRGIGVRFLRFEQDARPQHPVAH